MPSRRLEERKNRPGKARMTGLVMEDQVENNSQMGGQESPSTGSAGATIDFSSSHDSVSHNNESTFHGVGAWNDGFVVPEGEPYAQDPLGSPVFAPSDPHALTRMTDGSPHFSAEAAVAWNLDLTWSAGDLQAQTVSYDSSADTNRRTGPFTMRSEGFDGHIRYQSRNGQSGGIEAGPSRRPSSQVEGFSSEQLLHGSNHTTRHVPSHFETDPGIHCWRQDSWDQQASTLADSRSDAHLYHSEDDVDDQDDHDQGWN